MAQPDLSLFQRVKTVRDFDREAEEFELKKLAAQQQVMGQDPAAVKLANEIQAARASGDVQRLNDLQMSAKLLDRGVVYDQMGNPMAMGGYGDAVGSIAGAKAMYEQNAQNQSDLSYKPVIARDVAMQQAGVEINTKPNLEAATTAARLRAEDIIGAQANLGNVNEQSRQLLDVIGDIEKSPGLSAVVGAPNPLKGGFGLFNVPGTSAADFKAKLDQLGGKQFLQAFESLKGGGQITQIEGEKATNAIARMQTSQSEVEFKKSLQDFKDIVIRANDRAQLKSQQDPLSASQSAITQRQQQIGSNPNQRTELKSAPKFLPIPSEAAQALKQNPQRASEFDLKYGPGASKLVLGTK